MERKGKQNWFPVPHPVCKRGPADAAIVGKVPITSLWHAVPSFPTASEV